MFFRSYHTSHRNIESRVIGFVIVECIGIMFIDLIFYDNHVDIIELICGINLAWVNTGDGWLITAETPRP